MEDRGVQECMRNGHDAMNGDSRRSFPSTMRSGEHYFIMAVQQKQMKLHFSPHIKMRKPM